MSKFEQFRKIKKLYKDIRKTLENKKENRV